MTNQICLGKKWKGEKSKRNTIELLSNLMTGKKCCVATHDIDAFKKRVNEFTGDKVNCELISDNIYNVTLIENYD